MAVDEYAPEMSELEYETEEFEDFYVEENILLGETSLEEAETKIHFLSTDVILEVEGRDIHVNKQVLADNSPVFKAMFESDFTEKYKEKIPLPGKNYADFVDFLYTFYYPEHEEPITDVTITQDTTQKGNCLSTSA